MYSAESHGDSDKSIVQTTIKSLTGCFSKVFLHKALCILLCLILIVTSTTFSQFSRAEDTTEYTLKAVFLYNFAIFTSWPDHSKDNFILCIYGKDPFGQDLDTLMRAKRIYDRMVDIHRISNLEQLNSCQLVFISRAAVSSLPDVINVLKDKPVLTVADSPRASQQGVMLNMNVQQDKVSFEANLMMAKRSGLNLSSQLLRLATEVYR